MMPFNSAAVKVVRISGLPILWCFSVTTITLDDAQCKFQMLRLHVHNCHN